MSNDADGKDHGTYFPQVIDCFSADRKVELRGNKDYAMLYRLLDFNEVRIEINESKKLVQS
jgi:hypothetical protein